MSKYIDGNRIWLLFLYRERKYICNIIYYKKFIEYYIFVFINVDIVYFILCFFIFIMCVLFIW